MDAYLGIQANEIIALGRDHLPHMWAGLPVTADAGTCEVCDVLWLIDQREGDQTENLLNLEAAVADRVPGRRA